MFVVCQYGDYSAFVGYTPHDRNCGRGVFVLRGRLEGFCQISGRRGKSLRSRRADPLNELAAIGPFGQLSRRQKNSERRRQDLPSLRRLPSAAFSRQFIERNPQKNSGRCGRGAETFTKEYLRCDCPEEADSHLSPTLSKTSTMPPYPGNTFWN